MSRVSQTLLEEQNATLLEDIPSFDEVGGERCVSKSSHRRSFGLRSGDCEAHDSREVLPSIFSELLRVCLCLHGVGFHTATTPSAEPLDDTQVISKHETSKGG